MQFSKIDWNKSLNLIKTDFYTCTREQAYYNFFVFVFVLVLSWKNACTNDELGLRQHWLCEPQWDKILPWQSDKKTYHKISYIYIMRNSSCHMF